MHKVVGMGEWITGLRTARQTPVDFAVANLDQAEARAASV
jgi:hypothetical protein